MASISRDILADNKPAARSFMSLLALVCFQPSKFFRLMARIQKKHSVMLAALILALVSFSAIQQADLSMDDAVLGLEDDYLPEYEFEEVAVTSPGDPSQSWMIGLSAIGKQAIYWMVMMLVLSEVSLFKGRAPMLERNLQIAVWSSFPFAMMAALQIFFLLGGGEISNAGFTGFLAESQSYHELNPYQQSAVYALLAQFTFFNLWNFVLLYKGARESLRGNRVAVTFVLISWLLMLSLTLGFEHYQNGDAGMMPELDESSYDYESLPAEERPIEEPLYSDEMSGEDYP